jgi:hypothetical protein
MQFCVANLEGYILAGLLLFFGKRRDDDDDILLVSLGLDFEVFLCGHSGPAKIKKTAKKMDQNFFRLRISMMPFDLTRSLQVQDRSHCV